MARATLRHLLKVLPRLHAAGRLQVGELPPELHVRQGAIADPTSVHKLSAAPQRVETAAPQRGGWRWPQQLASGAPPRARARARDEDPPNNDHIIAVGWMLGTARKLPASDRQVLRGPAMLLHSKGLASLTNVLPYLAERFGAGRAASDDDGDGGVHGGAAEHASAARAQLVAALGSGLPEAKRKSEKVTYSPRTLAGFCLFGLEGGGRSEAGKRPWGRQWVLNTNGSCAACARPPEMQGAVGAVLVPPRGGADNYFCAPRHGQCGIRPVVWPSGDEPGLPDWFRSKKGEAGGAMAS